jgi:hypothetical protein
MAQVVEENRMTRDEYDDSQRQHPRARKQAAVLFHGFDPSVAMDVITRSMEPRQ